MSDTHIEVTRTYVIGSVKVMPWPVLRHADLEVMDEEGTYVDVSLEIEQLRELRNGIDDAIGEILAHES